MQLHPKHIPNPVVRDRLLGEFRLPLGLRVVYEPSFVCSSANSCSFVSFHKLLEKERLLLVLADQDKHSIYLEHLSAIYASIQRGRAIKVLHCEDVLFAYDEAKRMLTICASAKVSSTSLVKVGF
jgi:hypothetical protein